MSDRPIDNSSIAVIEPAERDAANQAAIDLLLEKNSEVNQLTEQQKLQIRAEKKARLAVQLERGIVHDRLHVNLPPDVYGEWVPNDPEEVARMQTYGFSIDTVFAPKRALHSDGSSSAKVGDTIFMTCDKETKEIIDEIKTEQFNRLHGKKAAQKEEQEYSKIVAKDTGHEIPTFTESNAKAAKKEEIKTALNIKD